MNENYTKGIKKLLKLSQEESIRLSTAYVGSEHLLLAIIKDVNGNAHKLLNTLGCDFKEMKLNIEKEIKSNSSSVTLGHLPLTRRLERILKKSYSLAIKDGYHIASQNYLLLAISEENGGLAKNILDSLSIDFKIISSLISDNSKKKTSSFNNKTVSNQSNKNLESFKSFSRNISKMAETNLLDPVIGRTHEIERVTQILSRRKKIIQFLLENPVLVKLQLLKV